MPQRMYPSEIKIFLFRTLSVNDPMKMVVTVAGIKFKRHIRYAEHDGMLGTLQKIAARFQTVQIEVFRLGVHDRSGNNFDIHTFVFAGVHVDTRTERVFRSESAAGAQGACCGDR